MPHSRKRLVSLMKRASDGEPRRGSTASGLLLACSGSSSSFQRSRCSLCLPESSGSARSLSTARLDARRARVGRARAGADGAGSGRRGRRRARPAPTRLAAPPQRAGGEQRRRAPARARGQRASERMAQVLFDIPGLELDAAIEVHREAGGDEERLDEQHGGGVRRVQHAGGQQAVADQPAQRVPVAQPRRHPRDQRQQAQHQEQLDPAERGLHHHRRAAVAAQDGLDALAARRAGLAFELRHRHRVRAPERQAPDRQPRAASVSHGALRRASQASSKRVSSPKAWRA